MRSLSGSSNFRIEGSWCAWRCAFAGCALLAGWALSLTEVDRAAGLLLWVACLSHALWAARWSLRRHWIEADGADGLQLAWPGGPPMAVADLRTFGPCWVLQATGSSAGRRIAALASLWPVVQRREFRRRWALRRSDPMRRDSAPSV